MQNRLLVCWLGAFAALVSLATAQDSHPSSRPPSLADAIAARADLWGELAMRQPNGASYEYCESLLPPPRYVHADFRYYPLVLSAPHALTKARLISNGSGVNLRGGSRSWKEVGTPVVFRVGPDEFRFGELRERLTEPTLAEGWQPIYEITYRHPSPVGSQTLVPVDQQPTKPAGEVYRLEAFASTDPALAEHGVVFVRFSLAAGAKGLVAVQLETPPAAQFTNGEIRDAEGRSIAHFDRAWKWERQGAHAQLAPGKSATLAIATRPLAAPSLTFDDTTYSQQRDRTAHDWTNLIRRAASIEVAEQRINNAWRNLLGQNLMLASGDRMLYSAGNQYEALYEAEGSDAALALLAWGLEDDARRMFVPLLDFTRAGLENHQAGLKLNDVIQYWWQTRDSGWVREMLPRIEREVDRLLTNRDAATGLLPKERYCGDIATPVHSLSVESKAWRALRDLPAVLRGIGEAEFARRVAAAEEQLRPQIQAAVRNSFRHETTPPFLPNALLDKESIHDPIPATRIGSYWNLVINYAIGSRLFPPGSPEEAWIPRYLETHGGLCLGMIRAGSGEFNFWTGPDRVNPLYGTRYVLDVLRRDDPERALVSFYGMLAQGFTRNTLVAGEGCALAPVDDGGRFFYCPPNSAGNAHFLRMLRNLVVQDWDLDDDGEPETLRLLFGTSKRWLNDGQKITVERMPTAFGPVSVRAASRLSAGQIVVTANLPERNVPKRTLLRARIPDGYRISRATIGGSDVPVDDRGTVDLTGQKSAVTVLFHVTKK